VLSRNPLCVECERQGRITPATVVDHIIPHKGNLELFWDEDNLQALCKPCHDRKTAKEGRWGEKGKVYTY
jgi:5-methylcytosine-specific restriction protein A